MSESKSLKQTLVGRVTSDKMMKTVTVLVERKVKHPLYDKVVKKSNKLHAHDEKNECKEGDTVEIISARPTSKTKSWEVLRIIERGEIA
jgi:small subunit ribosomal protein S17